MGRLALSGRRADHQGHGTAQMLHASSSTYVMTAEWIAPQAVDGKMSTNRKWPRRRTNRRG